jgi:hypothetical protein
MTKSIVPVVHDCPLHIDPIALQIHGYETYFTMHNESMGKRVTEGEHSMPTTIYFAICPDIVFAELPRILPKGFITSVLVNAIIAGIFGVIICQTCFRINKQKFVAEIKAKIRQQIDRPIWAKPDASHLPTDGDAFMLAQFSWNDGLRNNIQSMTSALNQSAFWVWNFLTIMAATEISISNARRSCAWIYWQIFSISNTRRSCVWIYQEISCVQTRLLREIGKVLHNFSFRTTCTWLHAFTVFVHSTMTDLADCNPLSSFNTDSSFWVCDDLATGHICNNKDLFTNKLVPPIYQVGSATGILVPNLMGTVILWVTDNEGVKHSFTLSNVNYLSDLPVNILSLCHLTKIYPDASGHPDRNGTGITSGYDNHTMYWNKGKFKKTFWTHLSGLPECLFSSGYSKLEVFSMMIANVYDDAISWAFTLKDKLHELAQLDDGDSIVNNGGSIEFTNGGVTMDVPLTLTNLLSFFDGMCLQYYKRLKGVVVVVVVVVVVIGVGVCAP